MAYGKPVGSLVLQSEQSFTANGRAQLRLQGGLTRRKPYGKTPRKTARKRWRTPTRAVRTRLVASRAPRRSGGKPHGGTERPPIAGVLHVGDGLSLRSLTRDAGGAEPFGARRGRDSAVGFSKSAQDLIEQCRERDRRCFS